MNNDHSRNRACPRDGDYCRYGCCNFVLAALGMITNQDNPRDGVLPRESNLPMEVNPREGNHRREDNCSRDSVYTRDCDYPRDIN